MNTIIDLDIDDEQYNQIALEAKHILADDVLSEHDYNYDYELI
jgi:hypothetical protein